MTFWNYGTFTRTSSVQGLQIILKWHNLQSLDKTLDLLIEFKFCDRDFYFLNGSKNCMVATYNFGSVYIKQNVRKYLEFDLVWACWVFIHFKLYVSEQRDPDEIAQTHMLSWALS